MTVAELKAVVDKMPQDAEVRICTNTPPGWMCPDGAAVGVRLVTQGRDWHMGEALVVPEFDKSPIAAQAALKKKVNCWNS